MQGLTFVEALSEFVDVLDEEYSVSGYAMYIQVVREWIDTTAGL